MKATLRQTVNLMKTRKYVKKDIAHTANKDHQTNRWHFEVKNPEPNKELTIDRGTENKKERLCIKRNIFDLLPSSLTIGRLQTGYR